MFRASHTTTKAGFLTPEQAQSYLAELRQKKKEKAQPTPPTNLPSTELNDWYSQQRKMQLMEQKKRVEAVSSFILAWSFHL